MLFFHLCLLPVEQEQRIRRLFYFVSMETISSAGLNEYVAYADPFLPEIAKLLSLSKGYASMDIGLFDAQFKSWSFQRSR